MAKSEFELFEEWARAKHHYQTVEALERFKILQKSRKASGSTEPTLDAATMAMLDKRAEED